MSIFPVLLAAHVLGLVWWIGGVAFVTCVMLPSLQHLAADVRVERIGEIERRFAWQARIAVLLVGISGAWMLALTSGWQRLAATSAWWLNLMIVAWSLFALMLFVVEPLGLPRRLGLVRNRAVFLRMHAVLLLLGLITIACGVIGTRGGFA